MSWFSKFFSRGKQSASPLTTIAPQTTGIAEDDPRIAQGHALLEAHWSNLGRVEPDVLSYIINPMFQGAPAWPNTRQAYRVVRTADSLILASDGLSDPFVGTDRDNVSGFGLEVWLEIAGEQEMGMTAIMDSSAFQMIETVAQNMAAHGGVVELLDRFGVMSMAVPMSRPLPAGWQDDHGQVGVLLGMTAGHQPTLELPFGPVRLVTVTPLRPDELEVAAQGAAARRELAEALASSPQGHRFDPSRQSVSGML